MTAAPSDRDDTSALPSPLRDARFERRGIYDAPEWYDVDYAGYRGEEAFYRFVLERHARAADALVVELGAGTGRLALRFAQQGFRIHAVEPAPAMRALLERKLARADEAARARVSVEDALAATFRAPGPAAVVMFPFNGLLHLPTADALRASFAHVRAALAPGGRFALDCTPPYWDAILYGPTAWGRSDERTHPENGKKVFTCDRSRYDPSTRQMHIDVRYIVDGATDGVEIELNQTMWTWQQVARALDDSGFDVEHLMGDVDLSPFDEGSPRLLVSATARAR